MTSDTDCYRVGAVPNVYPKMLDFASDGCLVSTPLRIHSWILFKGLKIRGLGVRV